MRAEVVVCPRKPKQMIHTRITPRAQSLHEQIDNSIYVNQYFNESNIEAHYSTTGPEIWEQTEGKITHYVASVGSGGTISGTAKFLKEQNPQTKVFGIDAHGSVLTKYHEEGFFDEDEIAPYNLEGVGKNIIPTTVLFESIDKFQKVEDGPSLLRAVNWPGRSNPGRSFGWRCLAGAL
ncbi:MAG: pyridoxal-phosphate dependent enzyme [Owenweeksia sp.]|nr:pyridoxal-phosphate dependent enzyme [Owenweeksia sp.]